MDLKIHYNKLTSASEAYEKIKPLLTQSFISGFKVKAEVTHNDETKEIKATGKGFSLAAIFKEQFVEINIDLSLMLKALKGIILTKVESELKKHI